MGCECDVHGMCMGCGCGSIILNWSCFCGLQKEALLKELESERRIRMRMEDDMKKLNNKNSSHTHNTHNSNNACCCQSDVVVLKKENTR